MGQPRPEVFSIFPDRKIQRKISFCPAILHRWF